MKKISDGVAAAPAPLKEQIRALTLASSDGFASSDGVAPMTLAGAGSTSKRARLARGCPCNCERLAKTLIQPVGPMTGGVIEYFSFFADNATCPEEEVRVGVWNVESDDDDIPWM